MRSVRLLICGVVVAIGCFFCGPQVGTPKSAGDPAKDSQEVSLTYEGRKLYIHVPERIPTKGQRALVIVLHGGMGKAERIAAMDSEKGMNLDAVSEKYGFLVAYLNGTPVTRLLGDDKKSRNAGQCCGKSGQDKVDEVKYFSRAVKFLADRYGVDLKRVYGVGHSNGAMMTQRKTCETYVYAAGISISGTLELETNRCTGAAEKRFSNFTDKMIETFPWKAAWGRESRESHSKIGLCEASV